MLGKEVSWAEFIGEPSGRAGRNPVVNAAVVEPPGGREGVDDGAGAAKETHKESTGQ